MEGVVEARHLRRQACLHNRCAGRFQRRTSRKTHQQWGTPCKLNMDATKLTPGSCNGLRRGQRAA